MCGWLGCRWDKGPRDATSVEELDSMIAERKQWMEQALSSEGNRIPLRLPLPCPLGVVCKAHLVLDY